MTVLYWINTGLSKTSDLRLCKQSEALGTSCPRAGFGPNLSQDLTSTMIQRKAESAKPKGNNDDHVAYALQQYNDTEGHFSLVR